MKVRILTLFDDEPVEPQVPAVKKKRTAKTELPEVPVLIEEDAPPVLSLNTSASPLPKETGTAVKTRKATASPSTEKNYYTIGETADLFRVRTSHIRFWTVQFALKVRTTRKGDRLYTPENIERLKLIHHLVKEQGFTIAGAKARLKEFRSRTAAEVRQPSLKDSLLQLKKRLLDIRDQL